MRRIIRSQSKQSRRALALPTAVLAGTMAFSATPFFTRSLPSLSFITHAHAEKKTHPLVAPIPVAKLASSLQKKPLWEGVTALHSAMKVNGSFGIQRRKRTLQKPYTAAEVLENRHGDCSDLAYWQVSGLLALGLDQQEDIKVGALLIHIKGYPDSVWHVVPVVLAKNIPPDVSYATFTHDREFRASVLKTFGIEDSKDWHMVIVDAQASVVGLFASVIDGKKPLPLAGLRAAYYREYGVHAMVKKKDHALAKKMFEEALRHYDGDPFTHTNLAHVLMASRKAKDMPLALEHAQKAYELMPSHKGIKQNYLAILLNTSISEARSQKYANAVAHLEEALKVAPDRSDIKNMLGSIYYNWGATFYNQGNDSEAIPKFQRAAELGNRKAQQALGR